MHASAFQLPEKAELALPRHCSCETLASVYEALFFEIRRALVAACLDLSWVARTGDDRRAFAMGTSKVCE
jgi:hypothetical protein